VEEPDVTDTEKLDEILRLLQKIDGELDAIPEIQALRTVEKTWEVYRTQRQSNKNQTR
jgi:hypothetical protein